MLSELELKAYSLEWGNPSFATHASNRIRASWRLSLLCVWGGGGGGVGVNLWGEHSVKDHYLHTK